MPPSFKRLILKASSTKQDVMDFTWENDWLLWGKQEADYENQIPFELTWITSEEPEDQARAVARLGVAAPQDYDSNFFDAFQMAFSNPAPQVGIAAIQASAYAGWVEFREIMERLKTADPDGNVRTKASVMLQAFNNQHIT